MALKIKLNINARAKVLSDFKIDAPTGEIPFRKGQLVLGEYDSDLDAFWIRRSGKVFDLNRKPIEVQIPQMAQ